MSKTLAQVCVAAAITVAVWLFSGREWTDAVIGVGYALSLWVMLFAGSWATRTPGLVATRDYALAAVVGTVLGYVFFRTGDDNGSFWAVGFIIAGAVIPTAVAATGRRPDEA